MINIKKKYAVIALIVIIGIAGYLTWQKSRSNSQSTGVAEDNSSIIFFYGRECPHCQEAEEYIATHELDKKVSFSRREVYHDKANANLLLAKGKECSLGEKEIGAVPMLWASGKCYLGGSEVENFLIKEADKNSIALPAENKQ